jgi:hypothetical protein
MLSNKIRLFVNTELPSWSTAVHLTTCARLYSGKWWNYHIYKVKGFDNNGVLNMVSFSPMIHLHKIAYNNICDKYYCYHGYNRCPQYEDVPYTYTRVKLHGPKENKLNTFDAISPYIKVPSIITYNDRIVIYDPDINYGIPDINHNLIPNTVINPVTPLI